MVRMSWLSLMYQQMSAMLMVVIQEISSLTLKVNGIVQKLIENYPLIS
jgi:hypothetical protein